ncbi:hypothetical protein [Streptomyces sp. NPDC001404]|uniref:hypothetical protein n=1 Tax=Streptomyces sp. NPDC001404 TaxID=3364571 RepID=UPI0036A5B535
MALYQVTRNTASTAQDLNQVINLLTGTDTSTPVTVGNRISAKMSGATAASAYVGGVQYGPPYGAGTFAQGDLAIDTVYGMPWTCYTASGGPYPQGAWQSAGAGGLVARWYQSYWQGLNSGSTLITLDTPSFDPNSMWDTSVWGYIIPTYGTWAVTGAVHRWYGSSGNYRCHPVLRLNGAEVARGDDGEVPGTWGGGGGVEAQLVCNPGDLIQLICYTNAPSPGHTDVLYPARTYLSLYFVGAQEQ